ncbi:hypothetical protein CCP4SC76_3860003 [Gammaproteobacteria bacterium]
MSKVQYQKTLLLFSPDHIAQGVNDDPASLQAVKDFADGLQASIIPR